MTESIINKKLIGLCKLYRGGNNPFNKQESEFEWYVWRFESVIVSNCGTGAMPMYASVNDHSRMARLFRKTGNGEWTADNIPPEVTHCRVFFAGAYSLYKGNSVEIQ